MKKCIGIISYLPDNEDRTKRKEAFRQEIIKLDQTLNLPIIVVTQNYKEEDKEIFSDNCILFEYEKLGVTKARKKLRKHLLESKYDMFILFDDDELILSDNYAKKFLDFIDKHKDSCITYYLAYLRGFAISRKILSQVPFAPIDAQKLEGWDDALYYFSIRKLFPKQCFEFNEEAKRDFALDIEGSNRLYPSSWKEHMSWSCFKLIERNTLIERQKIENDPNYKIPEAWFEDE